MDSNWFYTKYKKIRIKNKNYIESYFLFFLSLIRVGFRE